jgi:hypothetical protein
MEAPKTNVPVATGVAPSVASAEVHGKTMAFRRRLAEMKNTQSNAGDSASAPVPVAPTVPVLSEAPTKAKSELKKKKGCLGMLLLILPVSVWLAMEVVRRFGGE